MFEALGLGGYGSELSSVIVLYLIADKIGLLAWIRKTVFKIPLMSKLVKNGQRTQKVKIEKTLLCDDHGTRIGKKDEILNSINSLQDPTEEVTVVIMDEGK